MGASEIDLIGGIAQYGIAFVVLAAAIIYFLRRESKKEDEIKTLHQELRNAEKENLTALQKVTGVMERMVEGSEDIKSEIRLMRESIERKIDNLK
jgi:preprotein translocase subunit YajC